ncbi:unnamed protein product [Paramecium sonneborni]|uniref:Rieske domain-containing protein n=1 Tax=Paramecium sonneborni TaxID=65129 RepID=A0A8S1K8L7_9CILI|nr:unnamed protein product [Paramecium sonneborni]
MRRRILKLIPLFLFACKGIRSSCKLQSDLTEEQKKGIIQTAQMLDYNNTQLITYTSFKKPKEGELMPFVIQNGDEDYQIILTRYEGKIYALGSLCPYDLETDLSEGICFGDKLYCPKHGCQFDITNGMVEGPPSIDNLPKFGVKENEDSIEVYAPLVVPKKIVPQYHFRDYNDQRKVVIYGGGAAAFACLTTLREFGYTGEISYITNENYMPYDRLMMSKRIKATKPEDFFFRKDKWYQAIAIDTHLGRRISYINNKYNNTYVELDDSNKIAYDTILIATGTDPVHPTIKGIENQPVFYFNSLDSHQQLKEKLKNINDLSIIGINTMSLEVAQTIRKEYPNIKINVIDPNEESQFQVQYGPELANLVLDLHVEKGINVYENIKIKKIEKDSIIFKGKKKLKSDAVILFPSTVAPKTEFAEVSDHQFEFDTAGRVKVDYFQRTDIKRIFAAGSCAHTYYYTNGTGHLGDQWQACYNQGMTAAYNMLALNVPWHQIPFTYTEQFGKVLQQTSSWPQFDEVHIEGDLKKWDFIIYYGMNDFVVGAVGTPSKQNRVAIVNEGIRCKNLPFMSDLKNGKYSTKDIETAVRKIKKSGCYKNTLYKFRYDIVPEYNLWTFRDNMSTFYFPYDNAEISAAPKMKGDE